MNLIKALKQHTGDTTNRQVPVNYQIDMLGITPKEIDSLKGKRILDVGCGNGSLVEYLKNYDIIAEGMDHKAPKGKDHYIPQSITGFHPSSGAIPRDNNTYDKVYAFQNTALNIVFTGVRDIWQRETARIYRGQDLENEIESATTTAQAIISEIGRVLKPGSEAVIYPSIPRVEELMSLILSLDGLKVSREEVDFEKLEAYCYWEKPLKKINRENKEGYFYRTRIKK